MCRSLRPALGASLVLALLASAAPLALAQPAPVPRAIVAATEAPEALRGVFTPLPPGDTPIALDGAAWLQLRFADYALGEGGTLTIEGADGETQTFTQGQLEQWNGLSAVFNGADVTVTLAPGPAGPGETSPARAAIAELVIGLPGGVTQGGRAAVPEALRRVLGDDAERFMAPDARGAPPSEAPNQRTQCGGNDDRSPSNNPLVGRIMPIGCTGWLVGGGEFLTAGHCIGAATQTVEFNVPLSQANGTTVAPPVRDQYPVIAGSIVSANTGTGNDWAILRVGPNSQTGLMPRAVQGGTFALSNAHDPDGVRVTGYGVDTGAANQTQQTHAGNLNENTTAGANSATLRYAVDTEGGNSGSPVTVFNSADVAIGIHTNGGCTASGGDNAGTSFRNQGLWDAIARNTNRTEDMIWQNFSGQVHFWPILAGQRQGGVDIFTPVGPDWRLAGAGDFDGDGTDDILWQHHSGQVHWWRMRDGQRVGAADIFTPVGPDWRLVGTGDFNGDGTDDILWQHWQGQVHWWPIVNGQRQGGLDIATPVGPDWRLVGAGDLNADGTDDLVWQHWQGQVHWWPIVNGQRQGGLDIATPVGPDWTLREVGDVDGDGTDDIVWQNFSGQVHYWPIQNGQRLAGINVAGPVGPDWRLAAVGDID